MDKTGRNDPCPCGSGLKYKKCCYGKPPKPKFKAKVIKSGKEQATVPDMMNRIKSQLPKDAEFKMTEHDFRVSNGIIKPPASET